MTTRPSIHVIRSISLHNQVAMPNNKYLARTRSGNTKVLIQYAAVVGEGLCEKMIEIIATARLFFKFGVYFVLDVLIIFTERLCSDIRRET